MRKIKTLKKNYEFRNTLTRGKFYKGNYITIYIAENNKKENVIGIAIGKKLCTAVKRNYIKRRIRENFRLQKGYNIVFLWNKSVDIKEGTYWNIKEDMQKLLKKARMY